jgi:integrase
MYLRDLCYKHRDVSENGLSEYGFKGLLWAVSAWEGWAKRKLSTDDLVDERLNAYLDWLKDNRARDTMRSRRGHLVTLWRTAFDLGLVERPPRKIRKAPKRVKRIPEAWTAEEVSRLVAACDRLKGEFHYTSIGRSVFMRSLVLTMWDSALRIGDMLDLKYAEISGRERGLFVIEQNKTGDDIVIRLRPETLAAIDACMSQGMVGRELIWPWLMRRQQLYHWFKRLVEAAGVRRGSSKWVRRASITACERLKPGAGQHQGGHRSPTTTQRHYLDASQLAADRPLPPPIVAPYGAPAPPTVIDSFLVVDDWIDRLRG